MRIFDGKTYRDMTPEEIANSEKHIEELEKHHWQTVDYSTAVENEISKKYTIGQELAIQRQKDEKPEEYAEYFTYCEQCKARVKEQMQKYGRDEV